MKRLFVVVLFAWSSSVAEADAKDPPVPDAATPLAGNVLVWADATFYVEADDKAPTLKLASLSGDRRDNLGDVVPFAVVGTTGAFVEVEPRGYECTWTRVLMPDDFTQLRLFVKRSDLAPVVARPFSKNYANGTSIVARAGLPVVPDSRGGFRAAIETATLVVPIPATSVGHAYRFTGAAQVKDTTPTHYVEPRARVTIGTSTFELDTILTTSTIRKRGAITTIALTAACLAVRINVPSNKISEGGLGTGRLGAGGGGRGYPLGEHWVIPKGTPMFTRSMKRQLAITSDDIVVTKLEQPIVCVQRFVGYEQTVGGPRRLTDPRPAPKLELCVDAKQLRKVNAAPARP